MNKMGLTELWIEWMAMFVEFVDYSVLLNTQAVGPIISRWRLRQGDHLSPYLFIICVEGLSSLIHDVEEREVNRYIDL